MMLRSLTSSLLISHFSLVFSLKERSSTSNIKVELAGIVGGEPAAPYA